MAEPPLFSSQSSEYDRHQILQEQENADALLSQKPRKPPTVTPKRFRKFFTPRATLPTRNGRQSKAGRQLRDITKNGANRRRHVGPLSKPVWGGEATPDAEARPFKRRKQSVDIGSSPMHSSPLKHMQTANAIKILEDQPASPAFSTDDDLDQLLEDIESFPRPVQRLRQSGHDHRLLTRSFGGFDALTRGRRTFDHCTDWRFQTSNFASAPSDIHRFAGTALPFCTASCNTNSLIAIGEEEGGVRLVDAAASSDFSTTHVVFRPHHNAIMDIRFSEDDYMLATASGDQTARIIDMHTQRTICILSGHRSSVKQVRFQPNDNNMITTSSRDGSVLLWDMRCGNKGTVASLRTAFARSVDTDGIEPAVRYSKYSIDVGIAHRTNKAAPIRASTNDTADVAGVSVTAIEHLPNGREHLLLTTSEVNSSIRLWDLRNVSRRTSNALLSTISAPDSHSKTRNYGINAMALSGDGARLYTACRDGTVYAYSTNHLVLGNVPELSTAAMGKSRNMKDSKAGIGPLYGFRDPALRLGSFYIRASLRPARGDKTEMLALGSSENCAVLFPTDERSIPVRQLARDNERDDREEAELPSLAALRSNESKCAGLNETSIHDHGTALTRGHTKEVTSLTWSHDGDLVTVGDDFTARCWREDGTEARRLRMCGESGGQRWGCGWADVESDFDEEDD